MKLLFLLLFILTSDPHWQILKTANSVNGRSECGVASVGGKLYLLGGDGPANNVEVFDPSTNTWTKKSVAPVAFNHCQPVGYQNKIYVLAAFSGGGFPNQGNLTGPLIYDIQKDSWQNGADLDSARRRGAAGAALYNGKLYLVCGIQHGHSSGTTDMFDVYDPATNTWTALPNAPHIRDHCAAAVVGDKLYIAGGRNTSYHEPNNFMAFFAKTVLEVDCYDFNTGKWLTPDAKLPLGSGGGSMVNLDGKLYYMGGERATDKEQNRSRKNVYYLDPSTKDAWKEADSLKEARNGMAAAVINHTIYVFGGTGGPGGPRPGAGNNPPMPMPPDGKDSLHQRPPGSVPHPPAGPSPLEIFSEK